MIKNKVWLGIILSIILLLFSINGFTSYYKYTQESGTNFYVGAPDKADALEDTNEVRQIIDDLGALLVHSKRNDLYPKDETTGGTIQIPEAGLKFSNAPVNNDIAAYIAGEMTWQTKSELSIQPLDTALTNISALAYVSPSLIKLTAEDTYAVRTLAEIKEDLSLNYVENLKVKLDGTQAPTVNNDIDEGYVVGSRWVDITNDKEYVCLDNTDGAAVWTETTEAGGGASQLSDLSDVGVTTPTDKYVLVADGDSWESRALVEADISDLATYLEDITGESIFDLSDVSADPNADKYPKWDDDPGELVWVDAPGYTNLTSFVDQTAWRVFYSNTDGDVIELALGTDGQYLKSTGATSAPEFDTPTGAGDMLKATYDNDEDGNIDVAAGGTEKSAWTLYAIPYLSGTTAFGEITIGTAGQVLKVSVGATGYEFDDESDPTVDSDAEIKAILVDEVTKTGDFTAGRIAKINNATGIIEQGTNTDADVADAVTKKHSQNTDTDLDGTFEATFVKKTDTVNVLSDITSTGANIEDAVTKKHTQNTDTQFDFYNALGSDHLYSGDKDTQLVGESVVFGDLLYFNWTDKEWKKTDADAAATMPGLRIALESKADGETCLMLVKGYIRDDSAFEFTGSMVYASVTPGAMSSTAPTEAGDQIQRVGTAKSADILFFDPSIDVGEI